MTDEEYKLYLYKEIMDFCSEEVVKKTQKIPFRCVDYYNSYGRNQKYFTAIFSVIGNDGYRCYPRIYIENGKIGQASCNCSTYY